MKLKLDTRKIYFAMAERGMTAAEITKGISYDFLEFHDRLGRCPLGRTDFYGARRLFFYYLDVALKERKGR